MMGESGYALLSQLPGHWLVLSTHGSRVEADSKGIVSGSCRPTALFAADFLLKGDTGDTHPGLPHLLSIYYVFIKFLSVFLTRT